MKIEREGQQLWAGARYRTGRATAMSASGGCFVPLWTRRMALEWMGTLARGPLHPENRCNSKAPFCPLRRHADADPDSSCARLREYKTDTCSMKLTEDGWGATVSVLTVDPLGDCRVHKPGKGTSERARERESKKERDKICGSP
eukprot:2422391-Rhodomonas_salina.2